MQVSLEILRELHGQLLAARRPEEFRLLDAPRSDGGAAWTPLARGRRRQQRVQLEVVVHRRGQTAALAQRRGVRHRRRGESVHRGAHGAQEPGVELVDGTSGAGVAMHERRAEDLVPG